MSLDLDLSQFEGTSIYVATEGKSVDLVELLKADVASVRSIEENPPLVLMPHTYPARLNEDGEVIPGVWQHYGFKATLDLIDHTRRAYSPNRKLSVLIPGGYIGGLDTDSKDLILSEEYARTYREAIKEIGLSDSVDVIAESDFRGTRRKSRLAVDTRGEITFLKKFCYVYEIAPQNALQIARLPHLRARYLSKYNGFNSMVLSAEGILAHYHPDAVHRFVSWYRHGIQADLTQFKGKEERNFRFMTKTGRSGAALEGLAWTMSLFSQQAKHKAGAN